MAAPEAGDLAPVYERLKSILEPYGARMHISAGTDRTDRTYGLDLAPPEERTPATWFGAVRLGKRYVSYYLMPAYVDPSLLDGVSPALLKRMLGKSCFNLTRIDEDLIGELAELTKRGYEATAGDPAWGKRIHAGRDQARSNR